jgi:GntR family transcriptional regulator/MocR family aminotransferase
MFTLIFDDNSATPKYEQLFKLIKKEIETGGFKANEKLPSKRKLALHLKISPVTVETAYSQLVAEGYLRTVPKSGYFVQSLENGLLNFEERSFQIPLSEQTTKEKYAYDFKTNVVDTTLFPFSTWAKLGREVLSGSSNELLNVTHPQGSYLLRQEIAQYLYHFRGIKTTAEQIVVGAGSEYLLGLIIQLLDRKSVYGIENPGYYKTSKIYHCHDIKTIPIPLDEQGLSIKSLKKTSANVVHITPSHQFPLGIIMPVSRRISLMNWANEDDNRFIIEDDYDSEFRFTGQPIPALQGLDRFGKVIYINSFTKSLAPSLRINYMVLPPKLLKIYRQKFMFYSCTVPNFEQYTLSKFMNRGFFERHLFRMRNAYKERRDLFITGILSSKLAPHVEIIGQDAGLHFLMRVENGMDESQLVSTAKQANIRVYGLSEYYHFPDKNCPQSTVVIGYSGLHPDQINQAVELLESIWTKKDIN